MKINSPAEDRIIVDLTEQDMLKLDITYEEMDYSTIETRRVIWTVLDEAGKFLGRELDPSRRMIIEASPKNEGGCVLSFTILDGKRKNAVQKQLLKKQSECLICDFESLDALFSAAEGFAGEIVPESSLYEKGGRYRLILNNLCNAKDLKNYFSEFSCVMSADKLACDHTKEHWRILAEKNAISVLSRN